MPPSSCRTRDPVELLLRSILKRSALYAAATAVAACASPVEEGIAAPRLEDRSEAAKADATTSTGASQDAGFRQSTEPDGGPVRGDWRAVNPGTLGPALTCEEGARGLPIRAEGLRPAESYDYLALRQRSGPASFPAPDAGLETDAGQADAGVESWTDSTFSVLSETGTKCASASGGACAEQVAHHPAQFGAVLCVQVCSELSVVTTRGNTVQRWSGEPALRALLGEVDSAEDALLLVTAAGYYLMCDDAEQSSWRSVPEGYEVYAMRVVQGCLPIKYERFHLRVSKSGEITVLGSIVLRTIQACAGRKPDGLLSRGRELGRSKLGDYLAGCAHLEAASVLAFERLARELQALGAPQSLIDAAFAARADEVRHADVVGRLALGQGGELVEPEVASLPPRGLEEIALENAVEGCVRETFGALIGGYQAKHACNRALRSAMVRIAEDEARHAALSHRVHRWIMPKLSTAARERVRHAQQRAVFELAAEIALAPDAELASLAGLPGPVMSRVLLDELSKTLWRAALRQKRPVKALG